MPKLPDHIAEIGKKYGLSKDDLWDCQGVWVIYHKALERVAAEQSVQWDAPQIISADAENDVALIAFGRLADRMEWSVGEASADNYPKRGKAKRYPWAMAEKRAKDRVILKLIGLAGHVYSEEESDDFQRPTQEATPVKRRNANQTRKDGDFTRFQEEMVSQCQTQDQLRQWWRYVQSDDAFKSMPKGWQESFKTEVLDPFKEQLSMREAV